MGCQSVCLQHLSQVLFFLPEQLSALFSRSKRDLIATTTLLSYYAFEEPNIESTFSVLGSPEICLLFIFCAKINLPRICQRMHRIWEQDLIRLTFTIHTNCLAPVQREEDILPTHFWTYPWKWRQSVLYYIIIYEGDSRKCHSISSYDGHKIQ